MAIENKSRFKETVEKDIGEEDDDEDDDEDEDGSKDYEIKTKYFNELAIDSGKEGEESDD